MDKLKTHARFAPTYIVGVLCWVYRVTTEILRVTRLHGLENLPSKKERLFISSNHPSLLEPQVLVSLFGPEYIVRPYRYGPFSLADKKNYVTKWGGLFGLFIGERVIPIDRSGDGAPENARAIRKFRKALVDGGSVIGFLEGSRTHSKKPGEWRSSCKGNTIRKLNGHFAWFAVKAGATIIPVWCVRGKWLRLDVYIGKPVQTIPHEDACAIALRLEDTLLALADSTN